MVDTGQGLSKILMIPRGIPDLNPLTLDMGMIYQAENRLHEVSMVSPDTAPELLGYFNETCNQTTKYLAWVEYEILMAQKHFDLAKAHVILEKAPDAYFKVKDKGIKYNEDFREALVIADIDCQKRLDTLNALKAVKALLESKSKTFERAYYACRLVWEKKQKVAANPNFSGALETPELLGGFIGERKK